MSMVAKIKTDKYEDVIEKVIIDNKEQDRRKYAMEQYAPFNPSIEALGYGDYLFIGHNGVRVVFEYKTGSDFLSSIQNNHLHNQVYEMTSHEEYTFVIIECEDMIQQVDELYYSTGISMNLPQLNGAISEFCTVSTVVQLQTKYQAFDFMMRMAGKLIEQKPFCYKYGKKSPNYALNVLSAIKGVDKKAGLIVRTLKLHTLTDVINLTVDDLIQVDGIGKVKAEHIIKNIGEQL